MDNLRTFGRLQMHPAGAHVTSAGTDLGELFWLSSATGWGPGTAIRGGVPVIAPWFADLLGLSPKHGWARTSLWSVGDGPRASLTQDGIRLDLEVTELADALTFSLSARNVGDAPQPVQLAFHPYFLVSDVSAVSLSGLDGVEFVDRVTDATGVQDGDVQVSGLFDRIYGESRTVEIVDTHRVITVRSRGADATVVWNPGSDLPDMGPGEWSRFVCVEPALLGAEQLAPGAERHLVMEVSVSPSGS